VRGLVRAVLWLAGIFGAIALLLYLFVFDVWTVPRGPDNLFGASIRPTLMVDDVVLVRRRGRPNVGELARCVSPITNAFVVGRTFGRGGDTVDVDDHGVTTNGQVLAARHGCPHVIVPHPVTENLVTMNCNVAETGAWSFSYLTAPEASVGHHTAVVEPGKVYLVSDNRTMHEDSRDFGQVDETTCEHVVFRLWGERYTDASRRFTILW
jgi:signal peptidase I